MKVRLDRADTVVGQGTVGANGTWSASVQVSEAGTVSLVAEQNYQNVPSGPGLPQAFRVRPPRLTAVTVTTPTATSVKFEGSGYTGATVQISVVNGPGGGTPPAAPVNGGRWETTVTNWPFGLYNLSAIQKVSDNAGGWIESQPYTFNVDLKLPGPSDVTYTDVYQPTFSGKGLNGATVRLFDAVDDSKIAPDARVASGEWSTRALAEWGPTFKRRVKVLQFWDEQASPDAIEIEVTIPPVAPVMNPPVENGLSPNLSGTCWPEAELKLTFSDSAIEHIVDNHNGSWSFRRDEPFAPEITHTASLTQFAAQQTSLPAIKTFVVALPMRKPVLTYPEPNDEVGRNVTIRGRDGMAGATMQLRDAQFDRPLGQAKLLTADGEWFIELADLAFRRYTIDAQQTLEGRPSEYSEHLAFEVVLLPPEFDEPQPGGSLPRTSELSGRGMRGGLVDVWLQGASEPLLKDVFIDSDGHWKAKVTLPVGETTIRAVQRFEDQVSKESPWLTYDVVPAAPFIETPAADEHIGRRVVVSGFGVPGDSVTVKLGDAGRTVLGSSPVLEDRTWSLTVTFDQPGGAFGLMAVASSEGFDSADSPARAVVLGTYQPSIEVPAAGRWVGNPVRFEGQGRAGIGHVVSWFNPDRVWAPDLSVASGRWQGVAPQALPDGRNWCRFRQSITDAVDGATTSDWVESERFEMLSPPAGLTVDAR
ncbi:hypothetical protein [Pseudomonas brassicacearum]|uniref:hypothetical protein n=1 Tax=Pseudomonas brassicacearum TaxID=930166 RepID=UPI001F2A75B9|nr:hypothetical protein [Pseudomonas brassicacearum]